MGFPTYMKMNSCFHWRSLITSWGSFSNEVLSDERFVWPLQGNKTTRQSLSLFFLSHVCDYDLYGLKYPCLQEVSNMSEVCWKCESWFWQDADKVEKTVANVVRKCSLLPLKTHSKIHYQENHSTIGWHHGSFMASLSRYHDWGSSGAQTLWPHQGHNGGSTCWSRCSYTCCLRCPWWRAGRMICFWLFVSWMDWVMQMGQGVSLKQSQWHGALELVYVQFLRLGMVQISSDAPSRQIVIP